MALCPSKQRGKYTELRSPPTIWRLIGLKQNVCVITQRRRTHVTARVNRQILIHASFALLVVISIAFSIERVKAATAARKVRMSFAAISGSVDPIWIAKDLGFFEKNGLDVDPVLIQSGP